MKITTISNKKAAYNGALVAAAGVLAYAIAVMLYVIIRSSMSIFSILPASERNTVLWTNGFSIAYSVAVFSLLMSGPLIVAGAIAGIILRKVLLLFNPRLYFGKAIIISSITAIVLLLVLYILLFILLKERITLQYAETFMFWYLFPAIIFFIAVVISGAKMNRYAPSQETKS
jgi:hypothetical protein